VKKGMSPSTNTVRGTEKNWQVKKRQWWKMWDFPHQDAQAGIICTWMTASLTFSLSLKRVLMWLKQTWQI